MSTHLPARWAAFLDFWKKQARALKIQTLALYYAYRDPRTPWYARIFTAFIVAYAFSPIDLIPDFIPVLGYADDVIISVLVLRWVSRTAGPDALAAHWPGTPDGLSALRRLCGLGEVG